VVARGRFQGTAQILRYNRSFYVAGAVGVAIGGATLSALPWPVWLALPGWIALAMGTWWLLASIAASYWVYDASDLMSWKWVADLKPAGGRWASFHAGLDEATPDIAREWGEPSAVCDFFDPTEMTEASILRARNLARNTLRAQPVQYGAFPFESESLDAIAVVFSAHELRSAAARERFFGELRRALRPGGRLLLVEHLRDVPNFIVFGPGAFHFMSRGEWRRLCAQAGLAITEERQKTPFVAAFVAERD
jgi:SAM-dependent methyltransferase